MSTGYTIHVAGLAPETTEDRLRDFFSFCGKLTSVKKSGTEADITFEKLSAMKTSLMLNGGTLDSAHLEVTTSSPEGAQTPVLPKSGDAPVGATTATTFDQEDKPKAAIAAEYLAHGYLLGDHIIQRAIDVDNQKGISSRFLNFVHGIDKTAGQRLVGENQTISHKLQDDAHRLYSTAREADQQHGVSSRFLSYYTKALQTPIGQKVASFYNDTQKQVLDVHEEAKRLAAQKKAASRGASPPAETHQADATAAPTAPTDQPPAAAAGDVKAPVV